jgi:hypothetical protein
MTRQHAAPLLLPADGAAAIPLHHVPASGSVGGFNEHLLRDLVHDHPEILPIAEIDPSFLGAVSICTELATPAGRVDNFLVTPSGLPVLVECKLWKNPESRREVVGQILDYAKELSRWSSADLQREAGRRLKCDGATMLARVQAVDPTLDEMAFNDALTASLRRGRFLLVILGDGIREGVEAIAEYLQAHAGLHFSLGLVEMPVFGLPDGSRLVSPRVLARTTVIRREVVAIPDGFAVVDPDQGAELEGATAHTADPNRARTGDEALQFWEEFLTYLVLDDPEQPRPKPSRQGYIFLTMPAPSGSCWITLFRNLNLGQVGLTLSSNRDTAGAAAQNAVVEDWADVRQEIGGSPELVIVGNDSRTRINEHFAVGDLKDPNVRKRAFTWLADRANLWVNVLRPRIRSAIADAAVVRGD